MDALKFNMEPCQLRNDVFILNKSKKVPRKIAKKHNVTVNEVYEEIQKSVDLAMLSPDPDVQKEWEKMPFGGNKPTPEQLIKY